LLLLPLLSQAQPVGPRVVPESRINVRFYEVSAERPELLAKALAQSAPKVDGKPVLGKASYEVEWQLDSRQSQEGCQFNAVKVITHTQLLLPRWQQSEQGVVSAHQRWGQLLTNMFDYESRLKELLLRGASQVGGVIAALPPHRDCQTLQHAAWAAGSSELARVRSQIDAFQSKYRGGEALGVQWPK